MDVLKADDLTELTVRMDVGLLGGDDPTLANKLLNLYFCGACFQARLGVMRISGVVQTS